ncbi:MAG: hypothetical protein ABI330_02195 [Caldimonas sp.]
MDAATTGWIGENHVERWPTTLYGVNLLLCALAYGTFWNHDAWLLSPAGGTAFFVVVALLWLVPDRRIERIIAK